MGASANGDAQKGSEPGRFVTKISPVGDSVGAGEMILLNAEDMFNMQQTFGSYDFNEACNGTTDDELFSNVAVMSPGAISMTAPPTTTTPVLTGDSFVIRQKNNPKRPGAASYLRYEMHKSARTNKAEFHMLGGTSSDLNWDRKKGHVTVCNITDLMDTDDLAPCCYLW